MNTVHLYGTACLFCLIDGLHYHLEVTLVWIGNRHAASSSSRLASNTHKILNLNDITTTDYIVYSHHFFKDKTMRCFHGESQADEQTSTWVSVHPVLHGSWSGCASVGNSVLHLPDAKSPGALVSLALLLPPACALVALVSDMLRSPLSWCSLLIITTS